MDGSGPSALSLRNMRTIGDRPRGRRQGGSRARPSRLLFRLLRMSPEPRRVDVLDGGPWTTGAHTATSIASMTKASIMVSAPSETRTPQSSHHFAAEFCPIEFWNHTGSGAPVPRPAPPRLEAPAKSPTRAYRYGMVGARIRLGQTEPSAPASHARSSIPSSLPRPGMSTRRSWAERDRPGSTRSSPGLFCRCPSRCDTSTL
jgi:hypothetical protein